MKPRLGDLFILAAIVALAFGALFFGVGSKTAAGDETALIYQDGKLVQSIRLDKVADSREIQLDGPAANTLLVEKGRIRYEHSDCPDKTCVHTGWLSRPGQLAACLPNRTYIKIVGNQDADGEDVVVH